MRFDWRVPLVGLAGGAVGGFLGVGGGIVLVPLILWMFRVDRHIAHATSLAAVFIIAVSGMLGFALSDRVDWGAGLALAAGGMIGSAIGAQAMHRMSPNALRLGFALALLVAGVRMVF